MYSSSPARFQWWVRLMDVGAYQACASRACSTLTFIHTSRQATSPYRRLRSPVLVPWPVAHTPGANL